ncbi:LLM class flavin-dependent oxidoreductase [Frondihabitans cladoniiphilus]|uniref:Pyrimidine utilization protein A n=1 Tax=Frondihabitans cladoniiphilus TaxID=715785 RepID=A0ABP8W416_9MICO
MTRYGLFLPTSSNGHVASTALDPGDPTFEQNLRLTAQAESFGMDFVLGMVKFRGPGEGSRYWDASLEAFTLAGGLLAATRRIQVIASVGILSIHPAVVARMAATLDSIGPGRVGINVVSGWNAQEYSQMGLWPGDAYYGYRYEYAREYIEILHELWSTGTSSYTGRYFDLEDCNGRPRPSSRIPLLCAGSSEKGREMTARFADENLTQLSPGLAEATADIAARARAHGRDVTANVLTTVVLADTDDLAWERVRYLNAHTDHAALSGRREQSARDSGNVGGTAAQAATMVQAVNEDLVVAGSTDSVARQLSRIAASEGVSAITLQFDDFDDGLTRFGRDVLPLLRAS